MTSVEEDEQAKSVIPEKYDDDDDDDVSETGIFPISEYRD
jgi:hypothetical protein